MDPLGAGDLHHGSVQTAVGDQPHHPFGYQLRPAEENTDQTQKQLNTEGGATAKGPLKELKD